MICGWERTWVDAAERRQAIAQRLAGAEGPVSAAALAQEFAVSRQIIVGDVALLRAGGAAIAATPRGYVLPKESAALTYTVACVHDREGMTRELEIMVDNGCQVVDVVVEHPIYGELRGPLCLRTRGDVEEFLRRVEGGSAKLLSALTDGIHLHTIACPDQAAMDRVLSALGEAGFLLK